MDKPSPLTATSGPLSVLPPHPQAGAQGNAPVNGQDFRALLATQGVKPPAGAVPTAAEAQIEAAQIAAKANVAVGVKREPVFSGMQQPQPANIAAPVGERFLPLGQGPGAARLYSGPTPTPTNTSVDGLRATAKFATGPAATGTMKTSPVLTRTHVPGRPPPPNPAPTAAPEAAVQQPPMNTPPPKAVEAYTYGLRAASENKPAQIPNWFDAAVQSGLDKYDALTKANKKP